MYSTWKNLYIHLPHIYNIFHLYLQVYKLEPTGFEVTNQSEAGRISKLYSNPFVPKALTVLTFVPAETKLISLGVLFCEEVNSSKLCH